jgi:hypothetical protein
MLLLALVAALQAAAPVVTTEAPRDVGRDRATLVATVDPAGESVDVRFDYGTTTAYGVQSASRTVSGTGPREVAITVTGLTAGTTYHVRARAGEVLGADRTFRTEANPAPPGVSTGSARDITDTAATVSARVDPNRADTTVRFEYGTTRSFGSATATQRVTGDGGRTVTARLERLRPGTLYFWRVVTQNAAGVVRGATRSFRTGRGLTGVEASAPRVAVWGETVTIAARARGAAVSGVQLALETQEHPFTGVFGQRGAAVATAGDGRAAFTLPVFRSIRARVTTRPPGLTSPIVEVLVRPKVGLRLARTEGRRLRFTGTVWPRLDGARVSVQRRTASGRWAPVVRGALEPLGADRSRYALEAGLPRRASVWRAVVVPPADRGYVRGLSRERTTRSSTR